MSEIKETGCCPIFDPIPWDGKINEWENKIFIKDKVFTIFYMPINFGNVFNRFNKKIKNTEGAFTDNICLSDHTSKWNMDVFLSVNKEIKDAENIIFTGKYISKVYEGDYKNMKSWIEDFNKYTSTQNLKIEKMYYWYTTCPSCSKAYGKNYTVIFGKIIQ